MESKRTPIVVGLFVAAVAGVLFWIGFAALLFAFPDPQNGIGLVLSPCFALWFGGAAGAITFAWKVLPTDNGAAAIAPMILGCIALIVLVFFLGGEIFQMLHPTPALR